MFCSCKICTDKCVTQSLCNSRASCSRWRPPPSWIVKFTKLYWLTVAGGLKHITLPNFVKIGQSVPKILRFWIFQDGGLPPSWICLGHIWTIHSEYLWVSIRVWPIQVKWPMSDVPIFRQKKFRCPIPMFS